MATRQAIEHEGGQLDRLKSLATLWTATHWEVADGHCLGLILM